MTFNPQDIDAIFNEMDKTDCPGCVAAIIQDGQMVFSRGYGMANLTHRVPNRIDTAFNIASNSKQFTAMCLAMCIEEGLCHLEDDVRKYIPELPDLGRKISLAHLIHHTSGMRDYAGLFWLAGYSYEDYASREQILKMILRQKAVNYEPGSQYSYTNTGYFLLPFVIEKITAIPFIQYIQEKIFAPLGMKHTCAVLDQHQVIPNQATGYVTYGGHFGSTAMFAENIGDTNIVTTIEDLFLWDQNFYHNILGKGGNHLIDQMLTVGKLNNGEKISYAFGLIHSQYRGLKIINHDGGTYGFLSQMTRFPDQKTTIIVLCNRMDFSPNILITKIADIILEKHLIKPVVEKQAPSVQKYEAPAEALQKLAGDYSTQSGRFGLIKFTFDEGILSVELNGRKMPLQATADQCFSYDREIKATIRFETDKSGMPVQATITAVMDVVDTEMTDILLPVKPVHLTSNELIEYEGRYCSAEIDAYHIIKVVDGNLKIFIRDIPRHDLKPSLKDTFEYDDNQLKFQRDTNGKINRYEINNNRVRNLIFTRD